MAAPRSALRLTIDFGALFEPAVGDRRLDYTESRVVGFQIEKQPQQLQVWYRLEFNLELGRFMRAQVHRPKAGDQVVWRARSGEGEN